MTRIAHEKFSISQRKGGSQFASFGDPLVHSFPIQISNAACCWLGAVLESGAVQVEKIEQCLCGNAGQRWEG